MTIRFALFRLVSPRDRRYPRMIRRSQTRPPGLADALLAWPMATTGPSEPSPGPSSLAPGGDPPQSSGAQAFLDLSPAPMPSNPDSGSVSAPGDPEHGSDDEPAEPDPAPVDQDASDGEVELASDGKAHPWVTDFRNRHYAEASKLAQIIGNGATPDEILAVSGGEFDWGRDPMAAKHGNYFGLHSRGTDPSQYFPGQTGYQRTTQDSPLATFDPANGFFYSGLRFASRMKAGAGNIDLSDPMTFFSLAHQLGWGATNPKYISMVTGAYETVRRSAAQGRECPNGAQRPSARHWADALSCKIRRFRMYSAYNQRRRNAEIGLDGAWRLRERPFRN